MRSNARSKALVSAWFDFQPEAVRSVALLLQLAIAPHKAHVNLQLFHGSELPPGLGPLEGAGRGSRSLRCRLNQTVDPVQVEMLVAACVALARRMAGERPPRMAEDAEAP